MSMQSKAKSIEHQQMKIFQTIQMRYEFLGITSTKQLNQRYLFEKRVRHGFLLFGCLMVSHFMNLFYVASDFMEYMEGICTTSASIIIFVCFAAKVFGKTKLFEMIGNVEKLINASKTNSR